MIYRSHESIDNFNFDKQTILQSLSKENKDCYILGDYNIDLLKDEIHRPTSDFLDLIYSNKITPTILKPTRITETTATIIDNILTNSNDDVIKTNILVTDITDHFPTVLYKQIYDLKRHKNAKNKYVYKRIHSDVNIKKLKNKLSGVNWNNDILSGNDPDIDYTNFTKKFNEIYDECIPLKKKTEQTERKL